MKMFLALLLIPSATFAQSGCMQMKGKFQNSDVVYYLEQTNCSSVNFYVKRLLPPWGEMSGDYITDGYNHENELEVGSYSAKIDQNGLTVVNSSGVFRYVVKKGDCDGYFPNSKNLVKQTLDPQTGEILKCVLLGF